MVDKKKILILIFTCIILTSCSFNAANNNLGTNTCQKQPNGTLDKSNVKSLTLSNKEIIETGQVSSIQNLGYIFEAKAGEKLAWNTKENLCVWVFSPSNKLLKSTDLPEDGKYTLQISVPKGATSFNLTMKLEDKFQLLNSSRLSQENNLTFIRSDYPKSQCGDTFPTDSTNYPINFFPVEVPYSISTLNQVRGSFCRDVFKKGSSKIQIASFTTKEKAQEFANFVESEIKGTMVGSPTTIQTSQESNVISSGSPEKAVIDYYTNINARNYKVTWYLLSSGYRDRKSLSFSNYTEWWDTVRSVKISNVRLISREDNLAYIDAQLEYVMNDGNVTNQDTKFSLEWRQNGNEWIILDVKGTKDAE